jgi:hypothetical protein
MTNNKNDKKIMALREAIEEKKALLAKSKKFTPVTSCSLQLFGTRYNIHALDVGTAVHVLTVLNTMRLGYEDLGVEDSLMIDGYSIYDYIVDVRNKLDNLRVSTETTKLRAFEATLNKLLSAEAQTELAIDEIEKLLK